MTMRRGRWSEDGWRVDFEKEASRERGEEMGRKVGEAGTRKK